MKRINPSFFIALAAVAVILLCCVLAYAYELPAKVPAEPNREIPARSCPTVGNATPFASSVKTEPTSSPMEVNMRRMYEWVRRQQGEIKELRARVAALEARFAGHYHIPYEQRWQPTSSLMPTPPDPKP